MTTRARWLVILVAVGIAVLPNLVVAQSSTDTNNAVILAFEGKVEVLPAGKKNWVEAKVNQPLQVGDQVRTGARSRVTVRLSNLSVIRAGENMTYQIEPPRTATGKAVLNLKSGSAYFFSRGRPQEIQLRTPVASGAIRGTEFNVTVAADGRTTLTLIDGEVELANADGAVVLKSGEQGVAESGRAPVRTALINAVNIIQWTLYYPAVLDPDELGLSEEEKRSLSDSLAAYRSGDLLGALEKYPATRAATPGAERIFHAGLLLAVGLVGQCEAQLPDAAGAAGNAALAADALRELIAAVKFQPWERRAPPTLASEWLAESYYQQSHAQLPEALTAARKAVEKSPAFGFAWARVADLEFSFGRTPEAIAALDKSLALSPRNAQAVALKGFLASAQNRTVEGLAHFDEAIALDGALANAWLGRGLCRIRRGDLEGGREDLEVAAALEPNRAILRSYLGKAFDEAGEVKLAEHELRLARQFDPKDPTSLLYSALLHQQECRINEAIRELEESDALNDNRRVYRSGMLLDQDAAVRGANLASIYRDAGMGDVSVREATRAVNADYANYSAHLFLANSFNQLRDPNQINLRYETPWLSEYLIANLLAPVGAGTLSQTVSQQEYGKLFERDRVGVVSSTDYSSRGDWLQSGSQYGNVGNFAYAVDAYYLSANGQRPNNDQEQRTISVQLKEQLSVNDSVFFQAILYDASGGDLAQYYDPDNAHLDLRTHEKQEPLLVLGYHHEWSPGVHTLIAAGRFSDDFQVTDTEQDVLLLAKNGSGQVIAAPTPTLPTASLDYQSKLEIYSAEAQQIFQNDKHALIVGARFQTGNFDTDSDLGQSTPTQMASLTQTTAIFFASSPISQSVNPNFDRVAGYVYHNWRIFEPLLISSGVVYDHLQFPVNYRTPPLEGGDDSKDRVLPKAGFTLTPWRDAVLRFAYTKSLGGVSFDQSVRLEPSQVAGFNQAFRSLIPESIAGSTAGADFETYGVLFEQKFKTGTYFSIGGELLDSAVDRTIGTVDLNFPPAYVASGTREDLDYTEKNLIVTANQLLGDCWSLGARYRLSYAELETTFPNIPLSVTSAARSKQDATLNHLALFGLFNHRSGFFARAEGSWYSQDNSETHEPGEDFWQMNLLAGYRFYRRHVQVQVGVLNLTDQDYRLNPLNLYPDLPRSRTFAASLQFNF